MKVKFYENEHRCLVVLNEVKKIDEYLSVIDLTKIKDALRGLELLGKEVCTIKLFTRPMFDIDTKYYHRYDEDFLNRLYHALIISPENFNLSFKNNRLYLCYEGIELICPIDMKDLSLNNFTLTLSIEYKEES